jgi:NAD(P)H-dependent FMN reductase
MSGPPVIGSVMSTSDIISACDAGPGVICRREWPQGFPGNGCGFVMNNRILVFYGSYRSDRMGIRLAKFVIERLQRLGEIVELIDAKAVNLPMLDRMYKEYPPDQAPEQLRQLANKISHADGFVFITGEYNWGIQPGLKNLTDYFLEEWYWRPAAIASYSAGRLSGARAASAWHGTLSEMGMVVISSTIAVGPIANVLAVDGAPTGQGANGLEQSFSRFADDLMWWVEAAKVQRQRKKPPY